MYDDEATGHKSCADSQPFTKNTDLSNASRTDSLAVLMLRAMVSNTIIRTLQTVHSAIRLALQYYQPIKVFKSAKISVFVVFLSQF